MQSGKSIKQKIGKTELYYAYKYVMLQWTSTFTWSKLTLYSIFLFLPLINIKSCYLLCFFCPIFCSRQKEPRNHFRKKTQAHQNPVMYLGEASQEQVRPFWTLFCFVFVFSLSFWNLWLLFSVFSFLFSVPHCRYRSVKSNQKACY